MELQKSEDDILASVLKNAAISDVAPQVLAPKPKARGNAQDAIGRDWKLPGFHAKARVFTIFGELPIEALRRRDKVRTVTGAYVEVEWIDKTQLDVDFLERHPEAQPILIRTSAFGTSRPQRNVMVSPGQKLRISGHVGDEGEKAAGTLTDRRLVSRMPHSGFTYYQFHCGAPVTVSIEGLWFHVRP